MMAADVATVAENVQVPITHTVREISQLNASSQYGISERIHRFYLYYFSGFYKFVINPSIFLPILKSWTRTGHYPMSNS